MSEFYWCPKLPDFTLYLNDLSLVLFLWKQQQQPNINILTIQNVNTIDECTSKSLKTEFLIAICRSTGDK